MSDEEDPQNLTLTVITESEDRAALEDIRDTKGNSNKTPAALKHFNNFLAIYCEEKDTPVVEADDIPYYMALATLQTINIGGMTSSESSSTT